MGAGKEKRIVWGEKCRMIPVVLFVCLSILAGAQACLAYDIALQWDPNTEPGLRGYKLYYKMDSSALPFDGTGLEEGSSPVDLQNVTAVTLHGLDPDRKYYFAITAYDGEGIESPYSNIVDLPVIISSVISMPTIIDNSEVSNATLFINGNVSDPDGIKNFTINGVSVAVAADGGFSHSLHLAKGGNLITATAIDNLDNKTTDTKTVILIKSDAPSDFEGDGKSDLALWRPQYGMWQFIESSSGAERVVQWGTQGDLAVPGDFDGDGVTDTAVWRASSGTWFIVESSVNTARIAYWGVEGDIPLTGDFDGDGRSDVAAWRPTEGNWHIIDSSTGATRVVQWGTGGDIPLTGDFDGDGRSDVAVWRPAEGNWYIKESATGASRVVQWGTGGDVPVTGYFDGDGRSDVAVWRPAEGNWYIKESATGASRVVQWGAQGDIPVPADFDGDGRSDMAVWRPSGGTWYVISSATGVISQKQYGLSTDQPL